MSHFEAEENIALLATHSNTPEDAIPPEVKITGKIDQISNEPLYPLNIKELFNITLIVLRSGLPISLNMLAGVIKGLISITLVSRYGTPDQLAGASLSTMFGITIVAALIFTINQGFAVLGSHLHGAAKKRQFQKLFQKNLCVVLMISIILLTILSFLDYILLAVGTKPEVCKTAGIYFRLTIPSILGLCVSDTLKSFLLAQNDFFIAGITQAVTLLVHIFWCYLFVFQLEMPFEGPAIARSLTDLITVFILFVYILLKSEFKEALTKWSKSCLSGWWSHLKDTLMIGFNYYVPQILFVVSIIIVIYLNDEYATGAQSLAFTLLGVFVMIPLGSSLAMQAKIGIAVGENRKYKAQKLLVSGVSLNLVICAIFIIIMIVFNHQIIDEVTEVPQTNSYMREILYLNCAILPADSFLDQISGVMRTLNKEKQVLHTLLIFYILFGTIAEAVPVIVLPFGYLGLWYGYLLSMSVTLTVLTIQLWKTNWDKEIRSIQENLALEEAKSPTLNPI